MAGLTRVRFWIGVFIAGLFVSGVTAFPLVREVSGLHRVVASIAPASAFTAWVARVDEGLTVTHRSFPFLAYGTDWLAYAHLAFALLFVGPWRDPVRNKWVLEFGLMACAGILPLALIAGQVRGIPVWWRLGDCSFGVFGALALWGALRAIDRLRSRD